MTTELEATQVQTQVVGAHFRDVSGSWGARYEQRAAKMSDLDLQLRRESFHRLLLPLLEAADIRLRVLDVGCGAGNLLDGIPRGRIHVTGVDQVPEMVAEAAGRFPGDVYRVADAADLPFADASFDILTSAGVLEYLSDVPRVLRGFARVLKPGGHLLVSFPNRSSAFRRLSRVEIALETAALRALNVLRRRKRQLQGPQYRHVCRSQSEVAGLLAQAGLTMCAALWNTYGLWGWLGRNRLALHLSRSMTRRYAHSGVVSRALACTFVVHARKPVVAGGGEG